MDIDLKVFSNSTVAAAVSGGIDSMALLHFLHSNAAAFNIKLKVVNVEHGIRGQESVNDTNFVKSYCQQNGIEFMGFVVDAKKHAKLNKLSLEAAARELRYNCFEKCLQSGANFVLTAHHMSDNAESILFNLFRGSALKGASGIAKTNGKIARPMLSVSRAQIIEYVKNNQVEYVVDKSNLDNAYSRNYLRNKVIPLVKKVFPKAEYALSNFAKASLQDDEFLYNLSKNLLIFEDNCVKITFCEHKSLFMRAVIIALNHLGAGRNYTAKQLNAVYQLQSKNNGSKAHLIGGVRAVCDYVFVTLYKESTSTLNKYVPFTTNKLQFLGSTIWCEMQSLTGGEYLQKKPQGLVFDIDKVPSGAVFRTRQVSDTFKGVNGHTKSLKKYFIDKKVPERYRDSIIILAQANEVLAVLNYQISDKIKVDINSKSLYKFFITKGAINA